MSGRAARSDKSPLTRAQLITLPLYGGFFAAMSTLGFSKYLGHEGLLILMTALISAQIVLAVWMVYRSDYATRHGMVAPAFGLLCAVPLVAGLAVVALSMAGIPELSELAIISVSGSMLLTVAWTLWSQLRHLVREGPDGPWVREHVDADACRIRADTLIRAPGDAASRKPWLAVAIGVNLPLIYQSWGITDNQVMPVILVAMVAGSVWFCATVIGPMAGKAMYLRRLERASGRRLFHEGYDDLQALRRGFWLSRLLMVDAAGGPASTGESDSRLGENRAQRLRRHAENTLYTLAFLFLLAGGMGFFMLGWPSWQQSLYFDGFRPAEVIVTEVAVTGRSPKWVGRGRVDGAEVVFAPGDLDPVIGDRPQSRDDPLLIAVRARLPIRAEVLWNPQVQRRLLPLGTRRDVVEGSAWFFAGGTSALAAFGVLLMLVAGHVTPGDDTGSRKRRQKRDEKR
jgi:hypothetical protein